MSLHRNLNPNLFFFFNCKYTQNVADSEAESEDAGRALSSQARATGWGVLLSSPSRGCLLLFCVFPELFRFCCALCSWMFSRGSSRERSILCINNLGKNFSCKIRDQTIWWRIGKAGWGVVVHLFPLPGKCQVHHAPASHPSPNNSEVSYQVYSIIMM